MSEDMFAAVCMTVLFMSITLGVCVHVLAAVGHIRVVYQQSRQQIFSAKRLSITILVYVTRAEQLESAISDAERSDYRQVDVVVINASGNARQHKKKIRSTRWTLYTPRVAGATSDHLGAAYRRSKHGEVVITLDGDSAITHGLIRGARRSVQQGSATRVGIKQPEVRRLGTLGLAFYGTVCSILSEATAAIDLVVKNRIDRRVGYVYTKSDFKAYGRAPSLRIRHTLSVLIEKDMPYFFGRPVGVKKMFVRGGVWGFFLLELILFMYAAVTLQGSELLLAYWLFVGTWLGVAVLVQAGITPMTRLILLFALPITPILMFVGMMDNSAPGRFLTAHRTSGM